MTEVVSVDEPIISQGESYIVLADINWWSVCIKAFELCCTMIAVRFHCFRRMLKKCDFSTNIGYSHLKLCNFLVTLTPYI